DRPAPAGVIACGHRSGAARQRIASDDQVYLGYQALFLAVRSYDTDQGTISGKRCECAGPTTRARGGGVRGRGQQGEAERRQQDRDLDRGGGRGGVHRHHPGRDQRRQRGRPVAGFPRAGDRAATPAVLRSAPSTAVPEYRGQAPAERKSTRLNSSHVKISYAVFCLKKKKIQKRRGYG